MSQLPQDSSAASASASKESSWEASIEHRVNSDEMFTLIDGILPFEACLYYQVVPLSIEGSRLNLGMVNPSDYAAAEYVRRQISYINYSVVTWKISSDWHRDSLSRYLSHSAKVKQTRQRPSLTQEESFVSARNEADLPNIQATLVVDTPEELEPEMAFAASPVLEVAPPLVSSFDAPADKSIEPGEALVSNDVSSADPLELVIADQYRDLPLTDLRQLSSHALMQALLSRVLEEGIGRLYFEKHADYGRVLWSKDGVVQSALDLVKPDVFQGVINELKRLNHLPMLRITKARQVEIERLYRGERVLLRFRVMPSAQGEEATLQVLRGTALRFYQQQQIENLGRDALGIAQNLQQRLHEIRTRARQAMSLTGSNRQEALPAIIQMLRQMEAQIQEMMQAVESENIGDPFKESSQGDR